MRNIMILICYLLMTTTLAGQVSIRAGVAKVNITPPYGTIINGDFLPSYASEIHDSLYARALAFDNGSERFVFIVVDNMTIDVHLINTAKEIMMKESGLKPGQVMISSTHAHSTGSVIETATVQADYSYRIYLPGRLAMAAAQALSNMQPAKVAWGHIDVPKHVACRRWYMKPGFPMTNPFGLEEKVWMNPPPGNEYLDRPAGPVDPQVTFIAVKSLSDQWISLLANYSTHYAGGFPSNVISADYYGEMDKLLKKKLKAADGFVGIMSNGTSGDVNTFDFRLTKNYPTGDYEKMKLIAGDITDSILVALNKVRWSDKPEFRTAYREIVVDRRKPSSAILEWATRRVRETDFTKLGTVEKASDDIKSLYALDIVKLNFYEPLSYKLPLEAVMIGDGTLGTIPDEIFAETGLRIKKAVKPSYYCTITLANGQFGYVPPETQFALGGYETWLCSGSLLETGAEKKISDALITLVKSLQ
jgi:neutral ceramidase